VVVRTECLVTSWFHAFQQTLVEGPRRSNAIEAGARMASGVYFSRLTAPGYTMTHKLVLME